MNLPDGKSLLYIAGHTLAAAAFLFVLQRFALGASTEASLAWAAVFGAGAAVLAWSQTQR